MSTVVELPTGKALTVRHSALTHLGEQGASLLMLMAKPWHKKPENLRRYVKPSAEAIAEVTSLLAPGDARRRSAQSAGTPTLARGGVWARIAACGDHASAACRASQTPMREVLSVRSGRHIAKARRLSTPCRFQVIAKAGPCGKARGMAQNRRPRPGLGAIRDSRSTCAFVDCGFCGT